MTIPYREAAPCGRGASKVIARRVAGCTLYRNVFRNGGDLDRSRIPIREIKLKPFLVKDPDLKRQIGEKLKELKPTGTREEQYCDYSYRFEDGEERIIIKQYANGKLQFQGIGGDLFKNILETVIALHNLRYPNAKLSVDDYIEYEPEETEASQKRFSGKTDREVPLPYIGTDESGKGDYFGPMVIAGLCLDEPAKVKLEAMGIRDSKLLSDKRCRELAAEIRIVCNGKFIEVEIPPERYNEL